MIEDTALVEEALNGNEKAFEMIIKKYQQPLLNYIGRMVGERELALDFTQEVFIKIYSSLRSYQPQYKFSTWLFKIASNLVIDYWRKKKITGISIDQSLNEEYDNRPIQIPDNEPSIVKKFELAELKEKIERTLELIPASLKELFVLKHVSWFSYEEIAEMKELPLGTVKNRIFQAKEMIRQLLREKE